MVFHEWRPSIIGSSDTCEREAVMMGFIALLLVIWLALVVIGAVIEGLFWLVVVGAVLFLATAAYGWAQRRTGTRAHR